MGVVLNTFCVLILSGIFKLITTTDGGDDYNIERAEHKPEEETSDDRSILTWLSKSREGASSPLKETMRRSQNHYVRFGKRNGKSRWNGRGGEQKDTTKIGNESTERDVHWSASYGGRPEDRDASGDPGFRPRRIGDDPDEFQGERMDKRKDRDYIRFGRSMRRSDGRDYVRFG